MGNLVQFPLRRKPIGSCSSCGGHFYQRDPRHELCPGCYWWDRGLRALDIAKQAFRELRAGGWR